LYGIKNEDQIMQNDVKMLFEYLPRQLANIYHGSWLIFTTAVGKYLSESE
jgi:hypothetical protein